MKQECQACMRPTCSRLVPDYSLNKQVLCVNYPGKTRLMCEGTLRGPATLENPVNSPYRIYQTRNQSATRARPIHKEHAKVIFNLPGPYLVAWSRQVVDQSRGTKRDHSDQVSDGRTIGV